MKPIDFPGAFALGAPVGWDEKTHGKCQVLPVLKANECFYSCWQPSWRERLALVFGHPVKLVVFAAGQPPVAVEVGVP